MIDMPGDICVCVDCMQKSFDSINSPTMGFNLDDLGLGDLSNHPNIRIITPSDFGGEILPKKQRIKKKKQGEESKPAIDINKIPAPHVIKGKLDDHVVGRNLPKGNVGSRIQSLQACST